jgi:thiosulfate/3-mercaptopyruvate sulfurtransferase
MDHVSDMDHNGGYAKPHALVTTAWVAEHAYDPDVVLAEVSEDPSLYDDWHLPGAVALHWRALQDELVRDVLDRESLEHLLGSKGIANDDTIILYGDKHNWFAAHAYWTLKLYGHEDVRLMDGGRQKWIDEDRPLATELPRRWPTTYRALPLDRSIRARATDVLAILDSNSDQLVDVRSPAEYSGDLIAMPGYGHEGAQRAGHIPGARSVPWSLATREDGTFKSAGELRELYQERGIDGTRPVTTYCRIGERSSHSWFVLRELLGLRHVRNYDGSWTEWGNLIGVPIAQGV